MNKLFNKSGKLFSIWWILVMVIVTIGVVISASFFYSSYGDIRSLEAEALSIKINDCISNGAIINSELLTGCGIEPSFFETNSNYFVMVSIDDLKYKFGNNAFETDCEISKKVLRANNYPKCVEKEMNFNGKNIKILTGSNNFGRKNDLI